MQQETNPIEISKEIRQGHNISPKLLEDVLKELGRKDEGINTNEKGLMF